VVTRTPTPLITAQPSVAAYGEDTIAIAARLRDEILRQGIVEELSISHLGTLLSRMDIKPQATRMWLHSRDPLFREKVAEIVELYLNPPRDAVVVSIDEKTGMQAVERKYEDEPARPGRLARREFEYIRHGTQALIAAFEIWRRSWSAGTRRTSIPSLGPSRDIPWKKELRRWPPHEITLSWRCRTAPAGTHPPERPVRPCRGTLPLPASHC